MDYKQWISAVNSSLTLFIQRIGESLPSILGAVALLLVGWGLARLLRAWTVRLIGSLGWLTRGQAIHNALKRIGVERPAPEVIGSIIYWVVFLLFFTAATETLGLPVLASWLGGVSYYLPRVLVAVLIVFVGLLAGNLAHDAIVAAAGAAGFSYGGLLGGAAQVAILLIAVMTGVDQMGIESRFLAATITIVIGAVIGGAALAFGLGSQTTVSNIIASHYLRQIFMIGHTVKISGMNGKIVEFTPTSVILEHPEGRVVVPAKAFSESVSVLVTKEG